MKTSVLLNLLLVAVGSLAGPDEECVNGTPWRRCVTDLNGEAADDCVTADLNSSECQCFGAENNYSCAKSYCSEATSTLSVLYEVFTSCTAIYGDPTTTPTQESTPAVTITSTPTPEPSATDDQLPTSTSSPSESPTNGAGLTRTNNGLLSLTFGMIGMIVPVLALI
ncbi:hypothetical protein GGR57DRAFT_456059 [Xylariaceae sp. FL1272]|nr:hypothetical protein GGR57DRAFT_456059 [Xylariaceae sp. FL1272]